MAEDEDGVSNRKSVQNSNNGGSSQDNEQNRADQPYFPRLLAPETDDTKCNNSENGDASPAEAKSSSSKFTGTARKEENPFSFRHFLKRDLSLPGNSTYESTGARPKVYASTVQHSPTRLDVQPEPRRPQAKEKSADGRDARASDNTSSSSSVEVSFSVGDDTESKHNLYTDSSDAQLYGPGLEPPGMPSLPDFVQDHILVEQAYLSSNGPISVDLDNLPDFTFNTNYNAGASSSLGRRHPGGYGRGYAGYGPGAGGPSSPPPHAPLDLPRGAESAPAPDLQLSLDLTESVNPTDRRNMSPGSTCPLDLPPNAGSESMRLPDFLPLHPGRSSPVHPGRGSPEPEREDVLQPLLAELERTRGELVSERRARARLERELAAARGHHPHRPHELAASLHERDDTVRCRESPESESTVNELKAEIRRLKEELSAAQAELRVAQGTRAAAAEIRGAADRAEAELRALLPALGRLRGLGGALQPT